LKRNFIINIFIQFVLFFAFWLLLSGHYDLPHISYGIISCILVILLNLRLKRYYFSKEENEETASIRKGIRPIRIRFLQLLFYIPWLMWQIVVSSLQVAYVVLRPRMPINPSLLRFKTKLPNISSKVILGNSITLTPGTITIQIDGDDFLVHALMDISTTGIIDGSLPEQVAKLYEKKPAQVVQNVKVIKTIKDI